MGATIPTPANRFSSGEREERENKMPKFMLWENGVSIIEPVATRNEATSERDLFLNNCIRKGWRKVSETNHGQNQKIILLGPSKNWGRKTICVTRMIGEF